MEGGGIRTEDVAVQPPLRIALVTGISSGGVAEHVATLADGLDPSICEVTLIYSSREIGERFSATVERLRARGMRVRAVDFSRRISPLTDLRTLVRLFRWFRTLDFDIVHFHSSKAGFVGRVAAWLSGTDASVLYTPNAFAFQNPTNRVKGWIFLVLERLASPLTDFLICTSPGEAAEARRHGLVDEPRLRIIENGIEVEAVPQHVDRPDDVIRIGTVARLAEQKDPLTLVQAAEVVCRSNPRIRFEWVGGGPLDDEVRSVLQSLDLVGCFELRGHHPDPRSLLQGWDIFVLPSRYEGLPYALLEAMAAGLPCVVTAATGNRDVVDDGRTGLVVPIGDPAALSSAILELVGDRSRRHAMGKAARQRVVSEYSVRRTVARTQALYREASASAPTA